MGRLQGVKLPDGTYVDRPRGNCGNSGLQRPTPTPAKGTVEPPQGEVVVGGDTNGTTAAKRKRGSDESTSTVDSSGTGLTTETGRGAVLQVQDCLKCEGCQKVAASPIHTCGEEGHVLCFLCYEKLPSPKTCLSCPSETFDLNVAFDRVAKRLGHKLTCSNIGCKEEPMSFELKQHLETNCLFRGVSCAGCSTVFKFNEWADHLGKKISQYVWDVGRELKFLISASSGKVLDCAGTKVYGNDFILRMQLTDTLLYVWMAIMGGETEAKKYFATISLNGIQNWPGNKPTASWTLPVIPYHDLAAMEKTEASFGTMRRKVFESATTFIPTRSVYEFKITVEIAIIPEDFVFAKN